MDDPVYAGRFKLKLINALFPGSKMALKGF